MTYRFVDAAAIGNARKTAEGYLVADAKVARVGVQTYAGSEVGKPNIPLVRVYRAEGEVFAEDAMASFTSIPITVDHPSEMVEPANWRRHARGFSGESVARDGGFLRVPLIVKDADAIQDIEGGKRELSCGYVCKLDWTPGVAPGGEAYDAVQAGIRGNHIAIVAKGRAGSECRVGDAWPSTNTERNDHMSTNGNKTLTIDGLEFEANAKAVEAFQKLQGKLGAKDAEISMLKAKVPDAAQLDELVAARAKTIDTAKRVLGAGFAADGKSDAQIRRAVVEKQLGSGMLVGKSDEYVSVAFDTIMGMSNGASRPDPVRDALRHGGGPGYVGRDGQMLKPIYRQGRLIADGSDPRAHAFAELSQRLGDAWKSPAETAA